MKKRTTAAQLRARLKSDPEYIVRKKERDEVFRRQEEKHALAEAHLVQELHAAAIPVNSVWDLVNSRNRYPQSIPILLDHLQRSYPDALRDGMARALAVPEAQYAWSLLVKLYREESQKRTKSGLAVALANIADDKVIDELIALAKDPQHGVSRVLLLDALRRSRLPQARKALMEFGSDQLLQKEAQQILRRLKRAHK
jgi:HEAT repeat protein